MNTPSVLKTQAGKIVEAFKDSCSGIRGGRPSAKIVEDVKVEYFGGKLPVKQLGTVGVVSPREIRITAWDSQSVAAIAKALELSLKLSVQGEGNIVRVHFPPLSEERRAELSKFVKKRAEEARISIRAARDAANKEAEKDAKEGTISEDDKFVMKANIQKEIESANKTIEEITEQKIKEIQE